MPYDVADEWRIQGEPMRVRIRSNDNGPEFEAPARMKCVARIVFPDSNDDDDEPVEIWRWYVRVSGGDADAQSKQSYPLQAHLNDTKTVAAGFVSGLPLEREVRIRLCRQECLERSRGSVLEGICAWSNGRVGFRHS